MSTPTMVEPPGSVLPLDKPGSLTLTCEKCTRQRTFIGETRDEAYALASHAGWKLRAGQPICKRCP